MDEKNIKVAIMGGYGTFHEIAALYYFKLFFDKNYIF